MIPFGQYIPIEGKSTEPPTAKHFAFPLKRKPPVKPAVPFVSSISDRPVREKEQPKPEDFDKFLAGMR